LLLRKVMKSRRRWIFSQFHFPSLTIKTSLSSFPGGRRGVVYPLSFIFLSLIGLGLSLLGTWKTLEMSVNICLASFVLRQYADHCGSIKKGLYMDKSPRWLRKTHFSFEVRRRSKVAVRK
jgi:hypothetical protein